MSKRIYYSDSYKFLYDKFLTIVAHPMFPLSNVKLSDFFVPVDEQKPISTYKHTMSRVLRILGNIHAKIRYVSSGSTGHFFKGIIIKNELKPVTDKSNIYCYFALKLTPYLKCDKYKTIYETNRPENTELNMLKCLSYFVLSGQTKHLLLPIQSFYCPIHEFVKLMEADKVVDKKQKYKKFIEDYYNDKYEDTVSVMVTELANEGDFLNYIRTHSKQIKPSYWKIFFFQLLSVLAIIHLQFPAFRHNDLKANNILLQKMSTPSKFTYTINNRRYILPMFDLCLKIWDFDFACIPGYVNNIKVEEKWTREINITTKQNRYYDLHFFFSTLQMFFPKIMEEAYSGKETVDFINDVVPDLYKSKTKANDKGRLLVNDEYITPLKLLENHKFFREFRVK